MHGPRSSFAVKRFQRFFSIYISPHLRYYHQESKQKKVISSVNYICQPWRQPTGTKWNAGASLLKNETKAKYGEKTKYLLFVQQKFLGIASTKVLCVIWLLTVRFLNIFCPSSYTRCSCLRTSKAKQKSENTWKFLEITFFLYIIRNTRKRMLNL